MIKLATLVLSALTLIVRGIQVDGVQADFESANIKNVPFFQADLQSAHNEFVVKRKRGDVSVLTSSPLLKFSCTD